ncbi:NADP-dependent oxidoreductase [Nonomuraea sp. NN258]|uniref:NADP-dependent oxidoreductase n=1 Tax=Nonomuraea antri TaxID=2730852 RepID=UPI00156A02C4|nr:NADP-dependent oxidoreductase [Nonomuraea antri]NRQ35863.1 NADP-dependent oxidoreductase [Nonomuraea antri]
MRAVAIADFGADPKLVDVPAPEPGPAELLVRLHAAAYNPVDMKIAQGVLKDRMPHRFPLVLGQDGAGVVEAVGPDVNDFKPGDQVYGRFSDTARGLGSYAEYGLAAEGGGVALMPAGMIPEQAAAVPTATATAYDLVEAARLDAGQTVLIVGATGGVGQSVTQLAALKGAKVIATVSPDSTEVLRDLGAAETVDYRVLPVVDQVLDRHPDGIDAVIDLVTQPGDVAEIVEVLRPGGIICSTIGALDPDRLAEREIRGVNVMNTPDAQTLGVLADLIDSGELKIRIQSQVPLDEAPGLLRDLAEGGARGKTVIKIG